MINRNFNLRGERKSIKKSINHRPNKLKPIPGAKHLLHSTPGTSGVVFDGPLFRHLGLELALEFRQHVLAALQLQFGLLQLLLRVLELNFSDSEGLELRLNDLPM